MAKGIQESNGRISVWKAVSALLSLLLAVCTTLLGWVCFSVVDHEVRIVAIEANRFTARDALALDNEREKEMRELRSRLDKIPDHIPPDWFKEMVYRNHQEIEVLKNRSKQ